MAVSVIIPRDEMVKFLEDRGFKPVTIPGTKELVFGLVVDPANEICLRVYTSVVDGGSRGKGEDAIRCVLVKRVENEQTGNKEIKIIGADKRVHRVRGWRENLTNRLDHWREQLGPACPKCGSVTVQKVSGRGPFWGCSNYPVCKSVQSIQPVQHKPRPTPKPLPVQDEFDEHRDLERKISESIAAAELDFEMKHEFQRREIEQERTAYMAEMLEDVTDDDGDPPPASW